MQNDEKKPIPSPLIGGEFQKTTLMSNKEIEDLCKKYGGRSMLVIMFKKEDFPCKPDCNGYHGFGGDFNISHEEAHKTIEMITQTFNLDQCGTD